MSLITNYPGFLVKNTHIVTQPSASIAANTTVTTKGSTSSIAPTAAQIQELINQLSELFPESTSMYLHGCLEVVLLLY